MSIADAVRTETSPRARRWPRLRRSSRRPFRVAVHHLRWPVTVIVAAGAFTLAYYGYGRVTGYHAVPDRIYAAVALFRFSTAGMPPYPWQLEVARVLAAVTTAYAFFRAGAAIFNEQVTRWRAHLFARNHVLICGLGQLGSRLARSFQEEGFSVVAIDRAPSETDIASCKEHGIPLVRANANDYELLRLLRVDRAAFVMAVCGDDSVNAEVAVITRELHTGSGHLGCFVNIGDEALCHLLTDVERTRSTEESVTVSYFNIFAEGPRAVFRTYTLPDAGVEPPHVVIAGSGAIEDNLVLEACRRWVLSRRTWERRIRVTMLSPEAEIECERLLRRHPHLGEVCELRAWPADPVDTEARPITSPIDDDETRSALAIVFEDDDTSVLRASLRVRKSLPPSVKVVACTIGRSGVAQLLRPGGTNALFHVDNFPLLDRVCVSGLVLNGWRELVAQSIHANYVNRTLERDPAATGPTLVPWDDLALTYKQSNREQARGIETKLKAAGYEIEFATWAEPPLVAFSEEELDRLGQMEHDRWMDERLLDGWQYGAARDNQRKLHPDLLAWEELSDSERQKNIDAVFDIPDLLARAGLVVVPRRESGVGTVRAEVPSRGVG